MARDITLDCITRQILRTMMQAEVDKCLKSCGLSHGKVKRALRSLGLKPTLANRYALVCENWKGLK